MITKSSLLLRIDISLLDRTSQQGIFLHEGGLWMRDRSSSNRNFLGGNKKVGDYLLRISSLHKSLQNFFCDFFFPLFSVIFFLVYLLNTQHYASALFTSLVNNISSSSRWLAFSYCFPQISTFSFFLCLLISCNHQI